MDVICDISPVSDFSNLLATRDLRFKPISSMDE